MSPKPIALAAPGMERAIINTNGFFPFDIVYSRVLLEHFDAPVEAAPIAHHGSTFRANVMRQIPVLDTGVFQDFDAVHADERTIGGRPCICG